jgi:von Willebrand factor type A domain
MGTANPGPADTTVAPGTPVPGATTPAAAPPAGGTATGMTPTLPVTGDDDIAFVDEGDPGTVIVTDMGPEQPLPEDQLVEGTVCNSEDVTFTKVIPTVMLVLDRSTSMFARDLPMGNGSSPTPWGSYADRWEALRAAVQLIKPFAADIQLSSLTYTGFSNESDGACPALQGAEIVPALNNFAAVEGMLPESLEAFPLNASGVSVGTETPTGEALQAALEVLSATETEGPKYLVLITDGLPDTCAGRPELINKGDWCSHDPAYGVVQSAYTNGIKTYVIGIGFEVGDTTGSAAASDHFLNGLAHAGQGLEVAPNPMEGDQPSNLHCIQQESLTARGVAPENDFYTNWRMYAAATYGEDGMTYADKLYLQPDDATLGPELAKVVAGVRSCSFEMDDTVVRAQAGKGAVRIETPDGVKTDLVYDDPNGWTLDPANDYTVVVQGTACEEVQTKSEIGVKIQFPCEIRIPRVR